MGWIDGDRYQNVLMVYDDMVRVNNGLAFRERIVDDCFLVG